MSEHSTLGRAFLTPGGRINTGILFIVVAGINLLSGGPFPVDSIGIILFGFLLIFGTIASLYLRGV